MLAAGGPGGAIAGMYGGEEGVVKRMGIVGIVGAVRGGGPDCDANGRGEPNVTVPGGRPRGGVGGGGMIAARSTCR